MTSIFSNNITETFTTCNKTTCNKILKKGTYLLLVFIFTYTLIFGLRYTGIIVEANKITETIENLQIESEDLKTIDISPSNNLLDTITKIQNDNVDLSHALDRLTKLQGDGQIFVSEINLNKKTATIDAKSMSQDGMSLSSASDFIDSINQIKFVNDISMPNIDKTKYGNNSSESNLHLKLDLKLK